MCSEDGLVVINAQTLKKRELECPEEHLSHASFIFGGGRVTCAGWKEDFQGTFVPLALSVPCRIAQPSRQANSLQLRSCPNSAPVLIWFISVNRKEGRGEGTSMLRENKECEHHMKRFQHHHSRHQPPVLSRADRFR